MTNLLGQKVKINCKDKSVFNHNHYLPKHRPCPMTLLQTYLQRFKNVNFQAQIITSSGV